MSVQGDKGAKGDKGERGEGMSPGTRRAIVMLFALSVALSVASFLAGVNYYHRQAAAQQHQAVTEQKAQQRQGELIEQRLCTTLAPLAGLATLRPPAGNPTDNPSRAYEQQQAAKLAPLAQLGPDLGCGKAPRP